jgi:hypothetical protein
MALITPRESADERLKEGNIFKQGSPVRFLRLSFKSATAALLDFSYEDRTCVEAA